MVMEDFNTSSDTFATFVVSIFVLGFACGPLMLAPLSEVYGRALVYNVTNALFLAFTIVCGLARSESMLLVFRFFSGFTGVATITIGSGTIADLMPREKRGKAVSIWSVGTILGPMVGPIIGGYVTETYGWRSMFWFISIAVSLPRWTSHTLRRRPIINQGLGRHHHYLRLLCTKGDVSRSPAGEKSGQTPERDRD